MKNLYINQLPLLIQESVKQNLINALSELELSQEELEEALENAMNSRLSDLSDTIDIEQYL